jgi:hypothetical protein
MLQIGNRKSQRLIRAPTYLRRKHRVCKIYPPSPPKLNTAPEGHVLCMGSQEVHIFYTENLKRNRPLLVDIIKIFKYSRVQMSGNGSSRSKVVS